MKLLKYLKTIPKESIARRYFLMNTFDGSLTVLGIILALHFAGTENSKIVIISCLGAAIALMVSGIWSGYAAEKAERTRELKKLERHVMADLDDTNIGRRLDRIVVQTALVNGLSPLLAATTIISPYLASHFGLISLETAFTASMVTVTLILFSLGFIIGSISDEDKLSNGFKMLLAGVVVAVLTIVLEASKVI